MPPRGLKRSQTVERVASPAPSPPPQTPRSSERKTKSVPAPRFDDIPEDCSPSVGWVPNLQKRPNPASSPNTRPNDKSNRFCLHNFLTAELGISEDPNFPSPEVCKYATGKKLSERCSTCGVRFGGDSLVSGIDENGNSLVCYLSGIAAK